MKKVLALNLGLAALLLIPMAASGADSFLIAVASDDVEATSLVGSFPARSRYFLLFSGTDFVQVISNPFLSGGSEAASLVVDYLAQKGVGVVVAERFGPLMIQAINRKGMKYIQFSGAAKEAAEQVVISLRPPKKEEKMGTQ